MYGFYVMTHEDMGYEVSESYGLQLEVEIPHLESVWVMRAIG